MAAPGDSSQLLRRRSAAIGAAALLALVVIGVLVAGGGGSDGDSAATDPVPIPPAPAAGRRVSNGRIGAGIARPRGWRARRDSRSIELRSGDRGTGISIVLPPRARRSAAVLRSAVAAIRKEYRAVQVGSGDGRRVAGLPAVSAVVRATNRRGGRLSFLISAVQGGRRAWLVQVVSGSSRGGAGLVEAQTALNSLRLRG